MTCVFCDRTMVEEVPLDSRNSITLPVCAAHVRWAETLAEGVSFTVGRERFYGTLYGPDDDAPTVDCEKGCDTRAGAYKCQYHPAAGSSGVDLKGCDCHCHWLAAAPYSDDTVPPTDALLAFVRGDS